MLPGINRVRHATRQNVEDNPDDVQHDCDEDHPVDDLF